MRNNGEVRHTAVEMEMLRQEFALWYFDPFKEENSGIRTLKEWAEKHTVSYQWLQKISKEPSFVSRMKEFRDTHREESELALQNLIRFAHSENPRTAIPALKIMADVMGWNAPQQLEVTTKGMSMAEYLLMVVKEPVTAQGTPAITDGNTLEGEFQEQQVGDPWETEELVA